jgi:hypothetical protein
MAASGSCEDHGSREICCKCKFRDFVSQNELFRKELSEGDTQHKVYIPRRYKNIFSSSDFGFRAREGGGTRIDVTFYDTAETKPWGVVFHTSAGDDDRSHLTQNWGRFAREKNLKKGDVISFYKLETKRGRKFLMIGVEKEGYIFGNDFNN